MVAEGADDMLGGAGGGHDDDGEFRPESVDAFEQGHPVDAGHEDIGEDKIPVAAGDQAEAFQTVTGADQFPVGRTESDAQ